MLREQALLQPLLLEHGVDGRSLLEEVLLPRVGRHALALALLHAVVSGVSLHR